MMQDKDISPLNISNRTAICITTRNRSRALEACLDSLSMLTIQPDIVVVSDDSTEESVEQKNQFIVQKYSSFIYLKGPKRGVCANRNNALRTALNENPNFISFVDDDILLDKHFLENAIKSYSKILSESRTKTILTGPTGELKQGQNIGGSKLTFRGYFARSSKPEVVNIPSAVFPASLFQKVAWDENIFFGYEDAELCLRAKKNGFKILTIPSLLFLDTEPGNGTLLKGKDDNRLSDYQIYMEAARLYVGVKRYSIISPSIVRLILYFAHMSIFLLKKNSLGKFSLILKIAQVKRLFKHQIPDTL